MARRLISLPEAAGTPEGGKVLRRGSAPMEVVLATGPDDAEQAAGVNFPQVYRCFVPVRETHKTSGRESLLRFRAARREPSRGRDRGLRGRSRDILVRTA